MRKKIILIIVSVLLLILFFPYIKAEYLTWKYGDEFAEEYKQIGDWIRGIEYFRVIEYEDNEAVVCYIEEGHTVLHKFWFERNGDTWKEVKWDVVWTKLGGSADNFCWPYYR